MHYTPYTYPVRPIGNWFCFICLNQDPTHLKRVGITSAHLEFQSTGGTLACPGSCCQTLRSLSSKRRTMLQQKMNKCLRSCAMAICGHCASRQPTAACHRAGWLVKLVGRRKHVACWLFMDLCKFLRTRVMRLIGYERTVERTNGFWTKNQSTNVRIAKHCST